MMRTFLKTAFVAACCAASVWSLPSDEELRWEDYSARAHDGSPLTGRLGRLRVPENRTKPDGAEIELAFVVYKTKNPDPGPPVFFLVGGPGGSGVEHAALFATHRLFPVLDHCDVIGIDQRGTGLSVPNLSDGPDFAYELPLDEELTRADVVRAQRAAVRSCYEHWSKKGVDLAAYNTRESAADVDAVRRALGLEKVALWGTSYGSHLGLAVLRYHPDGVERAVLTKVEGPDHTHKLPSQVHARLLALHEKVAADPIHEELPDFLGTLRELLEQLADRPVDVPVKREDGSEVVVRCGPYDLRRAVAGQLADTRGHVFLPAMIHELSTGDWTKLGQAALGHRRGDMWSAMAMMMDCSSGMSAIRAARMKRELADEELLLSDGLSAPFYPEVCEGCGEPDLGEDFRAPFECDVPVLFVSGSLDARTPASNVDEIRAGFERAAHVVVENTGHDSRELLSPEYRDMLVAFLGGEEVADARIELRWDRFYPVGSAGQRR